MWESRVLRRAFERLELHEGKLSRAVLRGGGGGDVTSLPDTWVGNHPGLPGPRTRFSRSSRRSPAPASSARMKAKMPSVAPTARLAATSPTMKSPRVSPATSSGGSARCRRDGGEQGIEPLGHGRVRENGVAENRIGQPAENGGLHRGHDLPGLGADHREAEDAVSRHL